MDKLRQKLILKWKQKLLRCRSCDRSSSQTKINYQKFASRLKNIDEDVLMYAHSFPTTSKDFLGRREDPLYDVPLQNKGCNQTY